MVDKKFTSDNPWAEMSGLHIGNKEAKAPSQPSPETSHAPRTPEAKSEAPLAASVGAAAAVKAQESADAATEEYTAEDLQEMSLKELQALAKESGIDSKGMSKDELIDALASDEEALSADDEEASEEIVLEEDEESLEAEELDGEMSLEEALALLGEDSETEEDFAEGEFEVEEVEVQEGDVDFELDDNNSN